VLSNRKTQFPRVVYKLMVLAKNSKQLIEGDMKVVEYLSEFLFAVYATFED